MSLPLQAVDRLFARLTATYGRSFLAGYDGIEPAAVKTAWAHELSGFGGNLQALAWALENLPERAPNVIEFRNIARKAPTPEAPRLPEAPADPERLRAELAKLAPVAGQIAATGRAGTAWAHRILARAENGGRVTRTVLEMARYVAVRHPQ
jgi:hypothetical protein